MDSNLKKIIAFREKHGVAVEAGNGLLKSFPPPAGQIHFYQHICTCPKHLQCLQCQHAFRGIGDDKMTNKRDSGVYEGQLDDTEAESIIKDHVSAIAQTFQRLEQIVAARGDQILLRWKKISKSDREALLEKTFPGVSKTRWPLLQAETEEERDWVMIRRLHRNTWLLPFVDIGTMSDDYILFLRLLDLASSQRPADWCLSGFDLQSIALGVLGQRYNPGQVG